VTSTLIPSTGEMRQGAHIDLNWRRFAAGERVLFEVEFGRPEIGTIAAMDGNRAIVAEEEGLRGGNVLVTALKHRIRAAAGAKAEAELLARLAASHAEAPHLYDAARAGIVKAWNREHKPTGAGTGR
jgi:hypothetical protein